MNADNLQLPPHHARLGLWLGVLGVTIFALTLPMTRLAVGTPAAPQMSPWFVTFGRAALAGILSLIVLLVTRSPLPLPAQRKPLLIALTGNAIAYPLLLGFALLRVTASHAAVITALLPLVTAAVAAWGCTSALAWAFGSVLRSAVCWWWCFPCCGPTRTVRVLASNGLTGSWWVLCWQHRWAMFMVPGSRRL